MITLTEKQLCLTASPDSETPVTETAEHVVKVVRMLLITECSNADSTIGQLQYCYTFTLECIRVQNLNAKWERSNGQIKFAFGTWI